MKKLDCTAPAREPTPHVASAVDPLTTPRLSIEFRFPAKTPPTEDAIVRILHSWIQEDRFEGVTLIDVANYAHVQGGPGIFLMAHQAFFAVAVESDEVRFRYGRKARTAFGAAENLETVFARAEAGARRFALDAGLAFDDSHVVLGIDDRLVAPNTRETFLSVKPVVEAFVRERLGTPALEFSHQPSKRSPFRLTIRRSRL